MTDTSVLNETPAEVAEFEAMRDDAPAPAPAADPPKPTEPTPPAEPRKSQRLVPHEALHEERTRRQALERRLAELEKAQTPAPQQRQQQPEEIDENQDPLGAIAQLKQRLKAADEQEQRQRQQSEALTDLGRRVGARVNAYAAEHPEYTDQVKFLREHRFAEYKILGHDDDSAARMIMQEETGLAAWALERDMDPGEVVAKLAEQRGWKAPPPLQADPPPSTPSPDVERLERLQRGQRIAKSPSAAGGGAPAAELSLEAIAELDGAAFDAAFKSGRVRGLMA